MANKIIKDLNRGSVTKTMILFAMPLLFSGLIQMLYNTADMIIVGHLLQHNPELSFAGTDTVVSKLVPPKKAALIELNRKALELGKNY